MPSRRATIRDVAIRAGVSAQTISNLMNGRDFAMRPETRQKVLEAMAQLNYVPSQAARNLRHSRSGNIAFFVVDPTPRPFSDPFHGEVLSGIADTTRKHGCSVLIQAESSLALTPLFQLAREQRADAAVVTLAALNDAHEKVLGALCECPMPLVLLEGQIDTPTATCVMGDNYNGAVEAVRFLLARGHSTIGFLSGDVAWPAVDARLAGYRAALARGGIAVPPSWVAKGQWTATGGYEAAIRLLRQAPELTAVFCANDILAIGALHAARVLGRTPGRDLAIIGYDDFEFATYVDPPLTTVKLPGYEMGQRAAALLLHHLAHGEFPERTVVLPCSLMVRSSS